MAGNVCKNIVIGGGSGGVGRYLTNHLKRAGHNVFIVTRNPKAHDGGRAFASFLKPVIRAEVQEGLMAATYIGWGDLERDGLPLETDVVINLAGRSIGEKTFWNQRMKDQIRSSRIDTTTKLAKAIQKAENPPKLFISASAVGVYGLDSSKVYTEHDTPSTSETRSYFTTLCEDWERSSQLEDTPNTRVVNPRLGVVLGHDLPPVNDLLKMALGPSMAIGTGDQPFPWVHISDVISIFEHFMNDEEMSGPVNVVAPEIIDNMKLTKELGRACRSKYPVGHLPAGMFRLLYGKERAEALLLDSPRVLPQKLLDAGFQFTLPTIEAAAEALVQELSRASPGFGRIVEGRQKAAEK